MAEPLPPEAEEFFADHLIGLEVLGRLVESLAPVDGVTVRVSRSQVALWRRHGFAYLWLPGTYLARPAAELVLSLALRSRIDSPRWKEVVEPYPGRWMHHLEVPEPAVVDDQVLEWLRQAADDAG